MFAMPFGEIVGLLETSAPAARQLASRGQRRIRTAATPEGALESQRRVVDSFFAAARNGDFDALVALLDPDIVLRSDGGVTDPRSTALVQGAAAVAVRALQFANPAARLHPLVVNGGAGVLVTLEGRPFSLIAFTVSGSRIAEIDAIADPDRVRRIVDAQSAQRP